MEDCPICCEELRKTDILVCKHTIHDTCIIQSGKAECPICRMHLPSFADKITENDSTNENDSDNDWTIIDRMLTIGLLHCNDLPIIDSLQLKNDKLIIKAIILLHLLKKIL